MMISPIAMADEGAFFALRRAAILAGCAGDYPDDLLRLWTAPSADDHFREPLPRHFYGGWEAGALVASGMLEASNAQIDAVFVAPQRQGQGVGKAMMSYLEATARGLHILELTLDATLNAVAFYRGLGFLEAGAKRFHSPRGVTLDCVSMRKRLG